MWINKCAVDVLSMGGWWLLRQREEKKLQIMSQEFEPVENAIFVFCLHFLVTQEIFEIVGRTFQATVAAVATTMVKARQTMHVITTYRLLV